MDKYVVEIEAAIVDVDSANWFVVITPLDYGSQAPKRLASNAIWKLREKCENIFTNVTLSGCSLTFARSRKSLSVKPSVWFV